MVRKNMNFNGKPLLDLPTPSLVVDLDRVRQNLENMQHLVSAAGGFLRPHIKTHKCSTLARMQIEAGAIGITCATLGEAEAMARGGIGDLLIANQLVTPDKLERVALLRKKADVKFVVDSEQGILAAAYAGKRSCCRFEVLLEVDHGGKRCGVQASGEAVRLTELILTSPYLIFGGIQAYNGGLSYIQDLTAREHACEESNDLLISFVDAIIKLCPIPRVSGAGTGHAANALQASPITEVQSGSYIYSDTTYRELAPDYLPALSVLTTVLSRPSATRVVMDAGLKSIGTEFSKPEIPQYPGLDFDHFSEEHMQWEARLGSIPEIGEKVLVLPSHCCTTVSHYQECFIVQGKTVVDCWTIDAY
ncbi:MAG: alanine racemase [Chloroflexi bacterium]|nr:alanine racemase [Chloroflexota bacterium]